VVLFADVADVRCFLRNKRLDSYDEGKETHGGRVVERDSAEVEPIAGPQVNSL
jgi:hypothetical protein